MRAFPVTQLHALRAIWIAFASLSFGCAHQTNDPASARIVDVVPSRDHRILELQQMADVNISLISTYGGIDFNTPVEFDLIQKNSREFITFPEAQLALALSDVTAPRRLVVVQIPNVVVYRWSEAELSAKVDQIEAILKEQGFAHIAFHLDGGSFSQNYRETVIER